MVLSLPQPVLRLPLVQAFPLVPQSPALSQYALQHICESMPDERRDFFSHIYTSLQGAQGGVYGSFPPLGFTTTL